MIDFTNCEVNIYKTYGGANGSKIGIIYNNENYMLKFPPIANKNFAMSYSNSCISEYVCCKIFNLLGVKAQETLLGKYKDKTVVACKDLETDGFKLKEFATIKNTIINSSRNGYGTELDDILNTIDEQLLIDKEILKKYFWDMFVVDALLGNFDRHNGNWGFLIDEANKKVKISPVYDCGSCMYPQNTDENMKYILNDKKEIEDRIYSRPTSAIKHNDIRINYFNFLTTIDNIDCINSLKTIHQNIDINKINKIIDETPYISNIHKEFLKFMIKERKEKIIDYSIELLLKRENTIDYSSIKNKEKLTDRIRKKDKEIVNNKKIDKSINKNLKF